MTSGQYPIEVRAAVLADIATGESVSGAARKHGVSRGAIQSWRDKANLPSVSSVQQEKRLAIGEQLFDYLAESISTLGFQVRFFRDETWLKQQSAGELAVLHGVIADKTTRLLAALRGDDESSPGSES